MTNLLDERIDHHQSMDWTLGTDGIGDVGAADFAEKYDIEMVDAISDYTHHRITESKRDVKPCRALLTDPEP